MQGHGFREISTLFIILSEPNMSETEDQIKTVPIQCRYPFYTGADLRPVKAPWAPLVKYVTHGGRQAPPGVRDGSVTLSEFSAVAIAYCKGACVTVPRGRQAPPGNRQKSRDVFYE